MKYRDGNWLLREGVRVLRPAVTHRVTSTATTLSAIALTIVPRDRSELHDLATLTVELSSPATNVIRVRVTHFAGASRRPPEFQLLVDPPVVEIDADDIWASLRSGQLAARISSSGPWRLEFLGDDRVITASSPTSMGAVERPGHGDAGDTRTWMVDGLKLGVSQHVYGLGERFGPFVKNGQSIEIWNRDGGTGSEQAYKNVPFYLTDAGYGVFVNDPGLVEFEVGTERVSEVGFSVEGQSLEYFVIYGPTPKEVLERFTGLVGRPALPPAWSFGTWLSTSFTTDYDEATVTRFVQGMADRDIPLSVFHFDCFWMRDLQWVDFNWDERVFPDPRGMVARFKARGLRVCLWINPYVAQASPLFGEAAQAGCLVRRPNGDVWQCDLWQPGMALVDFTNPEARDWYRSKLSTLLDQGVDAFKTDFGERIPTEVVWHDGSDPRRMHNYYTYLYNQTVFDLLRERHGEGEAVVFGRSATAGSGRFPVHWGGDCESTFASMAETLRGGLSLGLSGFGFWSHDIGGFDGTPDPALYKRWTQFGLLSSHSRFHGNDTYRVPWLIDEESVDVVRSFARLKCRLMPYLYGAAVEASTRGIPMLRAMMLEFPDDPGSAVLDRQYMLGSALLVAPVFAEDGDVSFYVPAGRWTHLVAGEVVQGPAWLRRRYPPADLPLFVRPGTVLATGSRDDRPDYDFADGVTLRAYELADGETVRVEVPDVHGRADSTFAVSRSAKKVTATRLAGSKSWRLLVVNVHAIVSVRGATSEATPDGTLFVADEGSDRIEVVLLE